MCEGLRGFESHPKNPRTGTMGCLFSQLLENPVWLHESRCGEPLDSREGLADDAVG